MACKTNVDIKSCGVLVFRGGRQKSFLLMRHRDRWDLPKGHLDAGETELECALRELLEETGITSQDIAVDQTFRYRQSYPVFLEKEGGREYKKELVIFLAQLVRHVEIELTEHIGYRWHDWDPPHQIQTRAIDPVLAAVEDFWKQSEL